MSNTNSTPGTSEPAPRSRRGALDNWLGLRTSSGGFGAGGVPVVIVALAIAWITWRRTAEVRPMRAIDLVGQVFGPPRCSLTTAGWPGHRRDRRDRCSRRAARPPSDEGCSRVTEELCAAGRRRDLLELVATGERSWNDGPALVTVGGRAGPVLTGNLGGARAGALARVMLENGKAQGSREHLRAAATMFAEIDVTAREISSPELVVASVQGQAEAARFQNQHDAAITLWRRAIDDASTTLPSRSCVAPSTTPSERTCRRLWPTVSIRSRSSNMSENHPSGPALGSAGVFAASAAGALRGCDGIRADDYGSRSSRR